MSGSGPLGQQGRRIPETDVEAPSIPPVLGTLRNFRRSPQITNSRVRERRDGSFDLLPLMGVPLSIVILLAIFWQ
jgi:hypothetical protein